MSLILVTGGARAGKSTFAVQLAQQFGGNRDVCYLATAEPGDDEMRARIADHRASRPAGWRTLEVPRGVGAALRGLPRMAATWGREGEARAEPRMEVARQEPRPPGHALRQTDLTPATRLSVVLLDCVTMLVSNVLFAQADGEDAWPAVEAEIADVIDFAAKPDVTMIVVTNEVGLGIVPTHRVARVYRDLLGRANQRMAAAAEFVYFVVSGIPLEINGMQRSPITPAGL
jgi:adenosylcobinamide kinase/adenosylcobinamide-phosphate guanylyltransferase